MYDRESNSSMCLRLLLITFEKLKSQFGAFKSNTDIIDEFLTLMKRGTLI